MGQGVCTEGTCSHYMSRPRDGKCLAQSCSLYRCPRCKTSVVYARNQVCLQCLHDDNPKCELCKDTTNVRKVFTRYKKFVHLTTGNCHNCAEPDRKISAEGLCHSCTPWDYTDRNLCESCAATQSKICRSCKNQVQVLDNPTGLCLSCRFSGAWSVFKGDSRLRRCTWCGHMKAVNDEGVCRTCWVEEKASGAGFHIKQCEGCQTIIPRLGPEYCEACRKSVKVCECGRSFVPSIAEQTQCSVCLGICRKCGVNPVKYSDLCEECSKNTRKPWK